MATQKISSLIVSALILSLFNLGVANAQSKAYSRKKAEPAQSADTKTIPTSSIGTTGGASKGTAAKATEPAKDSEKLDIQELEQKYWAPKDTDFSVVQNRTYTKTKRWAASFMAGPVVNDPFNDGLNYALSVNYYPDERYGFEFMYQKSDLSDSDSVSKFRKLSGGPTSPDWNRDSSFYGIGFNYVPFYAKMSFMGKKIIYFDMQVTPFIGMAGYDQIIEAGNKSDSSFAYGLDITQFFFFSNNLAVRANLHNRFFSADVYGYKSGSIARSNESTNSTMFLMGLTYFY